MGGGDGPVVESVLSRLANIHRNLDKPCAVEIEDPGFQSLVSDAVDCHNEELANDFADRDRTSSLQMQSLCACGFQPDEVFRGGIATGKEGKPVMNVDGVNSAMKICDDEPLERIGDMLSRSLQEKRSISCSPMFLESLYSDSKYNALMLKILRQNQMLQQRSQTIDDVRQKLLRYKPGDWLVETGGIGVNGFDIPTVTTLLVAGPSGSGKSTLINNMIRVLNGSTRGFDKAQVYDERWNGSYFLQEYLLCENVKNVCVFDSRGLSEAEVDEDLAMLKTWMRDGVRHGEGGLRQSDSDMVRDIFAGRGRQGHCKFSSRREVNFVIFVVNALSVCRMKESGDSFSQENLARLYKSPFISFKDDRPVVVMTHGDELSSLERMYARIFIGEIFGVSPVDQVFDIPGFTGRTVDQGDVNPVADLVLLDMLEFALERAERNLPYKSTAISCEKVFAGFMEHYQKLGESVKAVVLGVFISWLFCLMLLIIMQCGICFRAHGRSRWAYFFGHFPAACSSWLKKL